MFKRLENDKNLPEPPPKKRMRFLDRPENWAYSIWHIWFSYKNTVDILVYIYISYFLIFLARKKYYVVLIYIYTYIVPSRICLTVTETPSVRNQSVEIWDNPTARCGRVCHTSPGRFGVETDGIWNQPTCGLILWAQKIGKETFWFNKNFQM